MKKVLIRANGIVPIDGYIQGIGRSNMEILKGLTKINDPDIEFSFYCNQARRPFYRFAGMPIKNYRYIFPDGLNNLFNFEPLWRKHYVGYDLLHITDNVNRVDKDEKFIVTIHDLFRLHENDRLNRWFHDVADYSLAIITDSEYSKRDIIEKLKVEPDKVKVVLLGIDHTNFYPRRKKEMKTIRDKFNIPEKYFFVCSCAHPRKNARDILAAFRQFSEKERNTALVLTWSKVPEDILSEYEVEINEKRIIILDFVTDEDLAVLYSGALASFLVSSFEGFGFPILESMACGTQCITCRNSSLTEIGADKAYFVKEHDLQEIVTAMQYFAENGKGDTKELQAYAKTYTWDRTTRDYLKLYKQYL